MFSLFGKQKSLESSKESPRFQKFPIQTHVHHAYIATVTKCLYIGIAWTSSCIVLILLSYIIIN